MKVESSLLIGGISRSARIVIVDGLLFAARHSLALVGLNLSFDGGLSQAEHDCRRKMYLVHSNICSDSWL